jgi:hypothetical protein
MRFVRHGDAGFTISNSKPILPSPAQACPAQHRMNSELFAAVAAEDRGPE